MPEATTPPLRGKRGRDRRIGERVADRLRRAPCADPGRGRHRLRCRRGRRRGRGRPTARGRRGGRRAGASAPRRRAAGERRARAPAIGCRTCPALPPLLAGPAPSARSASAWATPRPTPSGSAGMPASSPCPMAPSRYLAAALARDSGERLVWIARDAEIGDRVAEELGAWLGDPAAVAVLEPRTALAYERSELVADETAARVAALAAWRSGRAPRPGRERPGAPPAHDRAGRPARPAARAARRRAAPPGRTAARPVRPRLHARSSRSRGVASSPGAAGSSTSSRHRGAARSGSSSSATRSTRCARSTRPTSGRRARSSGSCCCRRPSSCSRRGRGRDPRAARPGGGAPPASASPRTSPGSRAPARRPAAARAAAGASRALAVGDAAEVWAAQLAPGHRPRSLDPGTLLVLDEPGDIAEAAEFLWRQADERRAELVEAGELPKDWPSTYLPPRDWKAGSSARGPSS